MASRTARDEGRSWSAKALLGLAALTLTACGSAGSAPPPSPPEAFFYSKLYELSRAYESLDVDRVAAFYAPEATSVTRDLPFKNDHGLPALRTSLSRYAGRIKTVKIVLSDAVQVRMSPRTVSTEQGFHAACQTKDGTEVTWDARHGATWEVRDGAWLIVGEYFAGSPELKPPHPLVVPVAGLVAAATVEPPEPMRVELATEAAGRAGTDAGAPPVPAKAPVLVAPVGPPPPPRAAPAGARGTLPGTQGHAATFVTPDWTGEPVYVVHFSSFRDRRRAERDVPRISRETGLRARTVAVDLGGMGTWYRVVAGEFRTLPEALAARNGLQGRKVQGVGPVYRMTSGKH